MAEQDWSGAAEFADDGTHRLSLSRRWGDGERAVICGANPSKAGADTNDPTIWRAMTLLRVRGFGEFIMLNWETYIATDPKDMRSYRDLRSVAESRRVTERNLDTISGISACVDTRFVAWGNLVPRVPQTSKVLKALSLDGMAPLYAFGLTKDGSPKHPMARGTHRVRDDWEPVVWRDAAEKAEPDNG